MFVNIIESPSLIEIIIEITLPVPHRKSRCLSLIESPSSKVLESKVQPVPHRKSFSKSRCLSLIESHAACPSSNLIESRHRKSSLIESSSKSKVHRIESPACPSSKVTLPVPHRTVVIDSRKSSLPLIESPACPSSRSSNLIACPSSNRKSSLSLIEKVISRDRLRRFSSSVQTFQQRSFFHAISGVKAQLDPRRFDFQNFP